jgi:hypothetical protein
MITNEKKITVVNSGIVHRSFETMRFTILLAAAFAAVIVAVPHGSTDVQKRGNPPVLCFNDQTCVEAGCSIYSKCMGLTISGHSANVCVTLLGRGGQGEVTSICDVGPNPPRPPTPHPSHGVFHPAGS